MPNNSYPALQAYVEGLDRRDQARHVRDNQSPTLNNPLNPVSDPYLTGLRYLTDLNRQSAIYCGTIHEAIPYVNSYKVAPERGGSTIQCCRLLTTPASPLSVADHNTLHVGTNVFYIKHPTARFGLILGVEPPVMTDARRARSDATGQGSHVGIETDQYWGTLWQTGGADANGGIIDFSARQPVDSAMVGEYCKTAMSGIQMFLDNYTAHLRVDEMCGLWLFYWDSLTRLAGYNFQRWTGGSVLISMNDEGEHHWYHGTTPYPWENLGLMQPPSGSATQMLERPALLCKAATEFAHVEPKYDDLKPFHRIQEWQGYVGQGHKRLIALPDPDDNYYYYSDTTLKLAGALEENRTLSGHFALRTSRGLTICKRPIIPVPHQIRELADPAGDSPDNYKPSSQYGSGSNHVIQVEPNLQATVGQEHLSRVAGIQDWHANVFNWEAANAFYYHDKDYSYPDESDLASSSGIGSNQYIPSWTELKNDSQWHLSEPDKTASKIKIDHRYEEYLYKVTQHLTFTEDGSVVLGDGSGSEIRMVGGSLFLHAAGDVCFEPGRNFMAWAGRDAIVRANQSVDITATTNDVRVKAERNMQLIAANGGGAYGMLLESRSTKSELDFSDSGQSAKSSGIILHAPCSELLGLADNIYLRTGVPSEKATGTTGSEPPQHGDIVIDAVSGTRDVNIIGHTVTHYTKCGVVHVFGTDGNASGVTAFLPTGANIAGDVYVDGALANDGPHILSGIVAEHGDVSAGQTHQASLITWADGRYSTDIDDMWYDYGRPGNDDMLKSMWGSLRSTDDYRSAGFILYETRWAQMGRTEGNIPEYWDEVGVEDGNGTNFPFPGAEQLNDKSIYYTQDTYLYDIGTGLSEDRGTTYEGPDYAAPTTHKLNCNYPVIGP